jgi:hypothetical protein
MEIPTHSTVRQAIQSAVAAHFVFVEWVADLTLRLIWHRLDSDQQVPGVDSHQDALGKTFRMKCRQPPRSGSSSHLGQYGTAVVQILGPWHEPLAEL